jgi:hypothetical protein
MKTIKDLLNAIDKKIPLIWLDPLPILNNDYSITYIEPLEDLADLTEEESVDVLILIQYGGGSEAQVTLNEIVFSSSEDNNL